MLITIIKRREKVSCNGKIFAYGSFIFKYFYKKNGDKVKFLGKL